MFKRNPILIVHLNSDTGIPPIPVFEKRFVMGRKPTHLVSIPDNSISRDHVEVIFQDGQVFVMDMGTSNGTTIDGQRIPNNIPTHYHQGKIINLGKSNVFMTIEIFEEDREKRKNNLSLKAIQQFNITHHYTQSSQEQTKVALDSNHLDQAASHHSTVPASGTSSPLPHSPAVTSGLPTSVSTSAIKTEPIAANHHHADPGPSIQTREDANRILAKAKIEAEMAAKDLLKNKEGEAQKLITLAENQAQDKVKEAEFRVRDILQHAQVEAQKLKDEKLEEARKEKEKLLAQVQSEKETILKDIDLLKQTIPSLSQQIDQLKIQTQKAQAEKIAAETQHTHENIRLEKLQSEIKHQELQLQSVNQQLQINQKKVQEAEEKHQQIVLANHSLIEETKMALEKARTREVELQTLVEKAKKETETATQYATEQRDDADSYSKVMKEEADLYAKTEREKLELWIQQVREKADREHTQLIHDREQSFQTEKTKQEQILDELRATEALKLKNLQDIDAILKQKSDDFESAFNIKSDQLESEFQTRKNYLEAELRSARESIERELTDRRTNIERELLERREILERESVEKKVLIENEAQELRSLRDKEYKELKMQQDAYLIDIKKREEERLKSMIEESRKMIREQFEQKKEVVQSALNEFFAGYTNMAPAPIKEYIPDLNQQLNAVLKDALLSEKFGEDKQLKQMFEYDPTIEKKHKKFWIRIAVASAIVLSILGYLLYNPKSISNSADSITEMVHDIDLENKKIHIDRMEQMKKASIYSPTKDNNFKSSYTENILYTNRYLEFEHDDEYRGQWIVSTKEFLIQEAKLIDDKADELLSKEGTLIIALSSENIDGQRPEKGISRMNETESEFNKFLAQNLNAEKIKLLKEKKQSFYERYINDPNKNRTPAASSK